MRHALPYELKQLRCFVTVGEDLHFGHAAKRLNMTQPPLSRQIQLLEHALDVQLLLRTSRSVQLTPAGRAFLADARRILALSETAATSAQRIDRGEAGLVRLGFTAASSYAFLPRLLGCVSSELKDVRVVLSEMVTIHQIEALAESRLDFGLLRPPVEVSGMRTARVASEQLVLAVPSSHRFAKGPRWSIRDLEGESFITFSPVEGRYFYQLIQGVLRQANISVKPVQQVSQVHSILALVRAGVGISIVPESAKNLRFEGVALRPLAHSTASAELHLAWNIDNNNPVLVPFRNLVIRLFVANSGISRAGMGA
jgi:DNA-binding transcriptional LysR family regulator